MQGWRVSELYLYGHPIAHSLSPAMHEAAFKALGLPHRYTACDVLAGGLAAAIGRLRRDEALGANITIPHKEASARLVDELIGDALAIGAVNTIVRSGPRLIGHDTDTYGFERALDAVPRIGRALLLGAGGGARACALVLLRRGVKVDVASRTRPRAEGLARAIESGGRRATPVDWPARGLAVRYDAVVNATPLGLGGEDPLAGSALPLVVLDIVPTLAETPLVRRAREGQDGVVVDGLSMLLHQAARSFELWTGLPAPLAVMRAALPRPE